jgi:hypothetical protein
MAQTNACAYWRWQLLISALAAGPAHAPPMAIKCFRAKAKRVWSGCVLIRREALSITANPAAATAMDRRMDVGIKSLFLIAAPINGNGAGLRRKL